ncbi:AAA family ATPase [Neptunomonas japonica]|uniref:ATP-binding protein n=1 Tax=Neptunomonas japonica JAMM 1380 TaxID=1441457 RepID=A0A7R6PBY1_9GAMM|nr:AAA family ATPase [Neptunomonas japonica]BBB29664.1 ATP-binding protein [Neptunomonas japonica JAMM 1380]
MITSLAINNYRSILNLIIPLGPLNVITGPNGTGKSNLYKALRLLSDTAQGGVVNSLAREGGLSSTYWAGPEKISNRMKKGVVPVQGSPLQAVKRLRLGFATQDYGYSISLGLPTPSRSKFSLDPEIKREVIWAGGFYRPASSLVDRNGSAVKLRKGRRWEVVAQHLNSFDSLFDQIADPGVAPEVFHMRELIRRWRFYDHFRTDADAPARKPQLGTRTPVLHHDGRDLAAALQTIREIGDPDVLDHAIADAFPGARVSVMPHEDGRFSIEFFQHGLLRPLTGAELSDGTLRYLLLIAALLTPRPPSLMVLNEPETSLHPDLLPALARLIIRISKVTQVWVVSHSNRLIAALNRDPGCHAIELEKVLGQSEVKGLSMLDEPPWYWPDKA